MIHYPWTRHRQRYEYVLMRGWVNGKNVADMGSGTGEGSLSLSAAANKVFMIDTGDFVEKSKKMWVPMIVNANPDRLVTIHDSIFNFNMKVDVCVAIEVFEHMTDPAMFIQHISKLCKNLFITTPLASITGQTRNTGHVMEYSAKDFELIVGTRFKILERKYQTSRLEIVDEPQFEGDSIDLSHMVQMLWCKVKK